MFIENPDIVIKNEYNQYNILIFSTLKVVSFLIFCEQYLKMVLATLLAFSWWLLI